MGEIGSGGRVEFEEICEEEVSGRVIHGKKKRDLLGKEGEGGIFFFFFFLGGGGCFVGEMWL